MKLKTCQHVMFLFYRLLHAAPGKGDDDDEEESSTVEQELINCLAEVYQTSQGTENKRGKKRMKANLSFFVFFFYADYNILYTCMSMFGQLEMNFTLFLLTCKKLHFLLWSTGGAQRTPVKQKMKTMCRSLQMLNVARLNVKAQQKDTEVDPPGPEDRISGRLRKRLSSDRSKSGGANTISE